MLKIFRKFKRRWLNARRRKIYTAKTRKEFEASKDKFVMRKDTDSIHYSGPCLGVDYGSEKGDSE